MQKNIRAAVTDEIDSSPIKSRITVDKAVLDAEKSLVFRLGRIKYSKETKFVDQIGDLKKRIMKNVSGNVERDEIPKLLKEILEHWHRKVEQEHKNQSLLSLPRRLLGVTSVLLHGGQEAWASDIMLATLDANHDGQLTDKEYTQYLEHGQRVVDAIQNFATNNGVIAALFLSMVFPMALDYEVDMQMDLRTANFVLLGWSSMLAFLILGIAARVYTHVSFWMPNIESKVWYSQKVSKYLMHLETCKSLLAVFGLTTLVIHAFVNSTIIGIAMAVPGVVIVLCYLYFEVQSSTLCMQQLEEQTRMVLPKNRVEKVVREIERETTSRDILQSGEGTQVRTTTRRTPPVPVANTGGSRMTHYL